MKDFGILAVECIITGLLVYMGLSGKQILFINNARTATITLGIFGFVMCMIMPTIGKFISNAPVHPITMLGYILGTIALITTIVQIFKWNTPLIYDPQIALCVVAGCIIIKAIIGKLTLFILK